jgi:hypothetical protein
MMAGVKRSFSTMACPTALNWPDVISRRNGRCRLIIRQITARIYVVCSCVRLPKLDEFPEAENKISRPFLAIAPQLIDVFAM